MVLQSRNGAWHCGRMRMSVGDRLRSLDGCMDSQTGHGWFDRCSCCRRRRCLYNLLMSMHRLHWLHRLHWMQLHRLHMVHMVHLLHVVHMLHLLHLMHLMHLVNLLHVANLMHLHLCHACRRAVIWRRGVHHQQRSNDLGRNRQLIAKSMMRPANRRPA